MTSAVRASTFEPSRTFLVTGASSGIGRAVAHRLIQEGATVLITGRDEQRLKATQETCSDAVRCHVIARDLTADGQSLPAWVRELARQFGPLSGVVHSAGVLGTSPLRVLSLATAAKVMDINFFSFLMLAQGLAEPGVADARGAALVHVSSVAALRGLSGSVAYSASKGAANAAVLALSAELAPAGIRCNAVLPAVVQTEMTADVAAEQIDYLLDQQFIEGRIQSGDIADACCFLLSDEGRFITGQWLTVDAGAGAIPGPRPLL